MISRREGDWWVTTPIYVGTREEILLACICKHEKFSADVLPPKSDPFAESVPGVEELVMEKCEKCCARRVRYKSDIEHVMVDDEEGRS